MEPELTHDRAERTSSAFFEEDPDFYREFGQRIVRFRRRKGWTQADLARELGVKRARLARWERGLHQPPLATLARFGGLLGVSLDELITGEPPAGTALTRSEQAKLADRLEKMRKWLR